LLDGAGQCDPASLLDWRDIKHPAIALGRRLAGGARVAARLLFSQPLWPRFQTSAQEEAYLYMLIDQNTLRPRGGTPAGKPPGKRPR